LFEYYERQEADAKAEQVARRLLERFPDHVPTLEALGGLCMKQANYAEALALFQRAMKVNPLDRKLRGRLSTAHLFHARTFTEAGQFDEARAEYQAARAFQEGKPDGTILCKWAACEFKAGNPTRAEELLQQALAEAGTPLGIAYSLLIETIRLKLPRALKVRFDKAFNEALGEPPTGVSAAAIAQTAAAHRLAGVTYHGQKTHEKKVLAYISKARRAGFTEEQLHKLCVALMSLEAWTHLRSFTTLGRNRFRDNPHFPLLEAESYIALGPLRCPHWKVQPLLDEAARLAHQLPPDEKRQALLETIQQRQEMVGMISPLGSGFLQDMLGDLLGDGEDDDEDW
jgi:tetratricopeptide (TPR) repeat protein